jgi:large subunit ribosomal protein L30
MAASSDVIEITQVRSAIGEQRAQRRTLRALGLRRMHHTVTQADRPEIRGMLAKVAHLIEVRRPGDDAPMGLEPGQELPDDDEDR